MQLADAVGRRDFVCPECDPCAPRAVPLAWAVDRIRRVLAVCLLVSRFTTEYTHTHTKDSTADLYLYTFETISDHLR